MGFFLGNRFAKSPMGQMLGIKGPSGAIRVVDPSGKLIGTLPRGFEHPAMGSVISYTGTGGDKLKGIYRGRQRGGLFGNFAPGDTFSHAEGGDVVRKSVRQAMGMDNETQSPGSNYGQEVEVPPVSPQAAPNDARPPKQEGAWDAFEVGRGDEVSPGLYPGDNVSLEAGEAAEAAERGETPAYEGLPVKQEPPMQQAQQPPMQQAQEAPPPQIVDQSGGDLDRLFGYQDPTEVDIVPPPTPGAPAGMTELPEVSEWTGFENVFPVNDEWADVKAEYAQGHAHAHANTGGMEMEITPPPVHGDPADVKPVEFGPQTMIPVPGSPRALKEGAVNEFVTPSGRKVPGQYKGGDPSKFDNWKRLDSEVEIPVSPPPRPGAPAGMTELPQAPQFNATGSVEYDYPIANAQVQYPGTTPPMPDRKPSQNPFFAEGDPSMPTRNPQRGMMQEAAAAPQGYNVAPENDIWHWVHSLPAKDQLRVKRLIAWEARGDGLESMAMVARSIKTRWENSNKSIAQITNPRQYENFNPNKSYSKSVMDSVDQALAMGAPTAPITHYHTTKINPKFTRGPGGEKHGNFHQPDVAGTHIGGTLKQGDPWLKNNPDRDIMNLPARKPEAPMDPHGVNSEGFPVMRLGTDDSIPTIPQGGPLPKNDELPAVPGSSHGDVPKTNNDRALGLETVEGMGRQAMYSVGDQIKDIASAGRFMGNLLIPTMGYGNTPSRNDLAAKVNKGVDSVFGEPTPPKDFLESLSRNALGYGAMAFSPGSAARKVGTTVATALGGETSREIAKQLGLGELGQTIAAAVGGGAAGMKAMAKKGVVNKAKEIEKEAGKVFKSIEQTGAKPKTNKFLALLDEIEADLKTPGTDVYGEQALNRIRDIRTAVAQKGKSLTQISKGQRDAMARQLGRRPGKHDLDKVMGMSADITSEDIMKWRSSIAKQGKWKVRETVGKIDDFFSDENNFVKGSYDKSIPEKIKLAKAMWSQQSRGEYLEALKYEAKTMKGSTADKLQDLAREIVINYKKDIGNARRTWNPKEIEALEVVMKEGLTDKSLRLLGELGPGGQFGQYIMSGGVILGGAGAMALRGGVEGVAQNIAQYAQALGPAALVAFSGGGIARGIRNKRSLNKMDDVLRATLGEKPISKRRYASPVGGALGGAKGRNQE